VALIKKIYLDQNAASYAAVPPAGSAWSSIRSFLERAFEAGKVVCPLPIETLVESAPCDRSLREAIDDLFKCISGGVRFRAFSELLVDSTLALVRPSHEVRAFDTINPVRWGGLDHAASTTRESHARTRERMAERVAAYTFPPGAETMTAEEIFRSSSLERCGKLWRDLERFQVNREAPSSEYEASWLMLGLIANQLTDSEANALCEEIRYHRWEAIPENFFDLLLGSRWDHDRLHGQRPRYDANDEIDRWRCAVAMANAGVFITDSYVADLCRRSRISEYSETRVFSAKNSSEILTFLKATLG
jgi:hypothetical protein